MSFFRNENGRFMVISKDLIERAREEGIPEKVILKETLQIYILSELYALPESSKVTFQGGTCLRLIYGAPRYSEDLDFVTDASPSELEAIFLSLGKSIPKIGPLLGVNLEVRKQKENRRFLRWKLHYLTEPAVNSFSLNIELACYPAYTYNLSPLHPSKALPGLPFVIVRAETLEEILADKLAAIAGRSFMKSRDLFDLWYLKEGGVRIRGDLLVKKLADYNTARSRLKENLSLISVDNLKREMERFLPRKYRHQLEADNYKTLLDTAKSVILEGASYL